jgi:oligoendopeptidase F
LEDLYAGDETWHKTKKQLAAEFDDILKYKGGLADSASVMLRCLNLDSRISKQLSRLRCYAAMKSDLDTRNSKYLAMRQEIQEVTAQYNTKASFIEPEIARIPKSRIDASIEKEPRLEIYRMYLYDIQRRKAHKLSEAEEKILARASLVADGPSSIYFVFSNAELPFPEITLSDGKTAKLNQAGYARYRALPNRNDRKAVFNAFWGAFQKFKGTMGAQLYAHVKSHIFYTRTRNYESSLHRALDENNIPTDVYSALIDNVNKNLESFHRYLSLKKRMLGVDTLRYYDVYASAVKDIDLQYSFEEARRLVLDALEPLGRDYVNRVQQAFENRWIDVYPTPGKRMGAYSNGSAYDVHPYILLNYNGQYEDVSTLAHELGHTMHSWYSNKDQPYPTADYATFVAEVASTLNEALLINKMLRDIEDRSTRLSLMMNYLEGLRQTLFRQTQFAEFELRIHQKAERGEPLTGDNLSELYGDILKKYYGHDKGICHIDDLYTIEWAYIPHFYYNFYVYQYATSFCASTALAEKVLSEEAGAVQRYIEFLSSGGSDYPINLLKETGVDMTTSAPFDKTMAVMNRTIDEIEKFLDEKNGGQP